MASEECMLYCCFTAALLLTLYVREHLLAAAEDVLDVLGHNALNVFPAKHHQRFSLVT